MPMRPAGSADSVDTPQRRFTSIRDARPGTAGGAHAARMVASSPAGDRDPALERDAARASVGFLILVAIIAIAFVVASGKTSDAGAWGFALFFGMIVIVMVFAVAAPATMGGVWCACKMSAMGVPGRLYLRSVGAVLSSYFLSAIVGVVGALVIGGLLAVGLPPLLSLPINLIVLVINIYIIFYVYSKYFSLGVGGTIVAGLISVLLAGAIMLPVLALLAPFEDSPDSSFVTETAPVQPDVRTDASAQRQPPSPEFSTSVSQPPATPAPTINAPRNDGPSVKTIRGEDGIMTIYRNGDMVAISVVSLMPLDLQIHLEWLQRMVTEQRISREYMIEALEEAKERTELVRPKADEATLQKIVSLSDQLSAMLPSLRSESRPADIDAFPVDAPRLDAQPNTAFPEISIGPVNVRTGASAQIRGRPRKPDSLGYVTVGAAPAYRIRVLPAKDDKQQVPCVWPAFPQLTSALFNDPPYFVIKSVEAPRVSFLVTDDCRFTVVESEKPESDSAVYATRVGKQWIVFEFGPGLRDEDRSKIINEVIASVRPRKEGEKPVDPFTPALVVQTAMLGSRIITYSDASDDAPQDEYRAAIGEELAKALGADPDPAQVRRWMDIVLKSPTPRVVPLLWKLAEVPAARQYEVRPLLQKYDPDNATDVGFAVLDLKLKNYTQAVPALSKAKVEQSHKPAVAKMLLDAMEDPTAHLIAITKQDQIVDVLSRWGDDKIQARLFAMASDPQTLHPYREVSILAIARVDEPKSAATISKWVLVVPDTVVEALGTMPKSGEAVAINLLGEKDPRARVAAAKTLARVGTQKSLMPLGRASRDKRDPTAAAEAVVALEAVKERLASATTKPAN